MKLVPKATKVPKERKAKKPPHQDGSDEATGQEARHQVGESEATDQEGGIPSPVAVATPPAAAAA
jgi:hypothetical protein